MTEREKMISGELYDPTDKLRELLPATEELPYLQAPVYSDYGCNTFFGKFSSANFNFSCLDVCEIFIILNMRSQ